MAIRVALHHKTGYAYDRAISLGPQVVRLRPAEHARTPIESYSLKIEPGSHFLNWQQDPQNNYLARVVFPEKVNRFEITVDLVAELHSINPFDFFLEPDAEEFPFRYPAAVKQDLEPYFALDPAGPLLEKYLTEVDLTPRRTIDFLVELNHDLERRIQYLIRMEPGVQSCEQTLGQASGSCRDSSWLLVQILRRLGLAARFVSGYLIQIKPDVKPLEGPHGAENDFCDLHAWAEVYLPGAGWLGLDPTSGLLTAEGHIPLACTPHYGAAAPIEGAVEPAEVEFQFDMKVTRVHEDPRVTKPYTEEQWGAIDLLGDRIDADLEAGDVRLTMGGEPTFVSIDDMEGAEWNHAAVGPMKLERAEELIRRLRERYGPGGLLHYGQGKWYPGEQLPRWALTCYWREDSEPVWRDTKLLAAEGSEGDCDEEKTLEFAADIASRLGITSEFIHPAYEDPYTYIEQEGRLPFNVDPRDSKLEDPQERDRMRKVFERGLTEPAGYVLPLEKGWKSDKRVWRTSLWMLRSQHLFLEPGDSPLGLRLPLRSLPWLDKQHQRQRFPTDPMAPRAPLPVFQEQRPEPDDEPGETEDDKWAGTVRTALCFEPRGGRLHVFMPPFEKVEDYLDLTAAVESAARERDQPVIIEGYPPPFDPRLGSIRVTPDPGVIEVNVHPSRTWRELVERTNGLYEDARQSRLGTEKFLIDGRHSGSGGGNHMILGGPTPPDSPLLRRPDLLRSLVSYWLNHPGLSYLFSGLFIGPTSQAPRVDETRTDAIYELEIAFEQCDQAVAKGECPPWLVDRIFRNLLVDLTGNTHRAEFSIDKLFSPDSSTGRLGLLEFRAFEMPPHARMSLTQQLLLRGLVSWFWREPYREKPIRWGTRLHDLFMLPHYVRKDFSQVIEDLRERGGYEFDLEWFTPHFEFRYPLFGRAAYQGVELDIRQAGEPWYVLGEEPAAGATARYVDSSVERVQVKVRGLVGERYTVCCNGQRVPLQSTGVHGEYVAGVRYRAWQPPMCLHPTIPVHTPLVFDVYDEWNKRSIGGCTYHVSHPGGRSFDTFPVNAYEAEGRRAARFDAFGHTPGTFEPGPLRVNRDYPSTLDLRRK